MRARVLAVYLLVALAASAGVVAYKGTEAYDRLPAPEPTVIRDVRSVDAAPARAFEVMSDPKSWAKLRSVESARLVPGSPASVEVELREWLVSVDIRAEYEARPPEYQQLRVVGGYLDGATITQTFEPDGAGTEVSTVAELDVRAFAMVSEAPEELVRERLGAALAELAAMAG